MQNLSDEVIAKNEKYEVIQRVLKHEPMIERERHEAWVVGYFMRNKADGSETPIDAQGGETFTSPAMSWLTPGCVEWTRDWVIGMRSSDILGEMPIHEARKLRFDFGRPQDSQISFLKPASRPRKCFEYSVLGFTFLFDFETPKLFIWT